MCFDDREAFSECQSRLANLVLTGIYRINKMALGPAGFAFILLILLILSNIV